MIFRYSNYDDKFPPDDYFTNITRIYTAWNGAYFVTDRKLESQVIFEWKDPEWWVGDGIQAGVGGFLKHNILESDIPSGYTQLL